MKNAFLFWTTLFFLGFQPLSAQADPVFDFPKKACSVFLSAITHPIATITGRKVRPEFKVVQVDETKVPQTVVLDNDLGLTLSKKQYILLYQAKASGAFVVKYAHTNIDGTERLVILLGEKHGYGLDAAHFRQGTVETFLAIGDGDLGISETWGAKARSQLWIWLHSFNVSMNATRIEKALENAFKAQIMASIIQKKLESGEWTEKELPNKSIKWKDDPSITGEDLIQLVTKWKMPEGDDQDKVKRFSLGEGHKPGLKENLASIYGPSVTVACTGAACLSILDSLGVPGLKGVSNAMVYGVGIPLAVHSLVGSKIAKYISPKSMWHDVFAPRNGMSRNISLTISQNIDKVLKANPDVTTMVTIVKSDQVPHLIEFLVENHGYGSGELPELDDLNISKPE